MNQEPANSQGAAPSQPPIGQIVNGHQWNGQAWVPAGVPPPQGQAAPRAGSPSKPWWKKWWVWVLIVIGIGVLGNLFGDDDAATPAPVTPTTAIAVETTEQAFETTAPATEEVAPEPTPEPETTAPAEPVAPEPEPEPEPTTEAPAPTSEYGVYPAPQSAFIDGVEAARTAYQDAETDLQRAKIINDRDRDVLASVGGSTVTGWVGVIDNVGANGEGKAYVSIKISDNIIVKTWNNAFSDIMDDTLIPESSPVYDALLPLTPGTQVTFSGSFVGQDGSTLYPTNVTDTFSALTPEFLFKFSAVAPN